MTYPGEQSGHLPAPGAGWGGWGGRDGTQEVLHPKEGPGSTLLASCAAQLAGAGSRAGTSDRPGIALPSRPTQAVVPCPSRMRPDKPPWDVCVQGVAAPGWDVAPSGVPIPKRVPSLGGKWEQGWGRV